MKNSILKTSLRLKATTRGKSMKCNNEIFQ